MTSPQSEIYGLLFTRYGIAIDTGNLNEIVKICRQGTVDIPKDSCVTTFDDGSIQVTPIGIAPQPSSAGDLLTCRDKFDWLILRYKTETVLAAAGSPSHDYEWAKRANQTAGRIEELLLIKNQKEL